MPLGREVGLSPGHIVLDGDPPAPPPKGHSPNFRPMSIVAKWSPISATAEHFFVTVVCILPARVQPTLDPYDEAFLWQAQCIDPGGEESG